MNVVALQVFVSLMLVAGSVLLFVHSVRQRDHEHADRLALAPLDEDTVASPLQLPATTASRIAEDTKETVCRRNG